MQAAKKIKQEETQIKDYFPKKYLNDKGVINFIKRRDTNNSVPFDAQKNVNRAKTYLENHKED